MVSRTPPPPPRPSSRVRPTDPASVHLVEKWFAPELPPLLRSPRPFSPLLFAPFDCHCTTKCSICSSARAGRPPWLGSGLAVWLVPESALSLRETPYTPFYPRDDLFIGSV